MPDLQPAASLSPQALEAGQRDLVRELAWASVSGAFSGGLILVAFALALGANALQVGLPAAVPFFAQAAQLPATVLIERTRRRRRISLITLTAARGLVLLLAVLPFLAEPSPALLLLLAASGLIALLNAVGGCAINSWLHQLIPHSQLGRFFSRRLFSGTTLACVGTLAAGALVEHAPLDEPIHGYALAFVLGSLAGLVSSWYLERAPEPRMQDAGPPGRLRERLGAPFRDANFRKLLVFLGAWTVASNFAAPFITVYLIEQRGYALSAVTSLWVASQFAIAALLGLYVMHALSRVREGHDISERLVIQEFAMEAWRSITSLAKASGALGSLFPFERLSERRKWWRGPRAASRPSWPAAPRA